MHVEHTAVSVCSCYYVYILTDVGRALLRSGILGEALEGPRSVAHILPLVVQHAGR